MQISISEVSQLLVSLGLIAGGIWHVARIEIRLARLQTLVELLLSRSGLKVPGHRD